MEGTELATNSPISAVAARRTASGRESSAVALSHELVKIVSREPLSELLSAGHYAIVDVRPFCATLRAKKVLTANGLWSSRALFQCSTKELLSLKHCGIRTVEDVIASLLLAVTAETRQEYFSDEDLHLQPMDLPTSSPIIDTTPLNAKGFLAAIRGRHSR